METNFLDNVVARPSVPAEAAPVTLSTPNIYLDVKPTDHAPFTLYQRDNQIPYAAKFFDIQDYNVLQQIEPSGIVAKLQAIEDYVRGKIETDNYFDSTKTFDDIMADIRDILGIKDFEPSQQQIDKIHSFVLVNQPKETLQTPKPAKAQDIDRSREEKRKEDLDKILSKRTAFHFKRLDDQFNKIDKTLTKRVDNQLNKTNQKLSQRLSENLKAVDFSKHAEALKQYDKLAVAKVQDHIQKTNQFIEQTDKVIEQQIAKQMEKMIQVKKINQLINKVWDD